MPRIDRKAIALSASFFVGIVFWGGFNWSMEMTNTEDFCISCHEMNDNVYQEYKKTIHYTNSSGVRATCPDCHVPREWVHKLIRKVGATNELFHKLMGSIDTVEKFRAKRLYLARQVWAGMASNGSRECRNCHHLEFMRDRSQPPMAATMHRLSTKWGKTCIDCHQGISHRLPEDFDREALVDELHKLIENDGLKCPVCHEDMRDLPTADDW